jgi:hypothetical protein
VPICNEAYAPSPEQVAWSRRVIEAFEEGVARGTASVSVGGRMIDIPIAEKARRILARADAIAAKEARKAEALRLAGVAWALTTGLSSPSAAAVHSGHVQCHHRRQFLGGG